MKEKARKARAKRGGADDLGIVRRDVLFLKKAGRRGK